MGKAKVTIQNPHGLTGKQNLAIAIMVKDAKAGKIRPVKAHDLVYNTKNIGGSQMMSRHNLKLEGFREALLDELEKAGVVGINSQISKQLMEGLKAEGKEGPDYVTRLKYIQEIHKVAGVYAPQLIEKKTMSVHADISEEELDAKIAALQMELRK